MVSAVIFIVIIFLIYFLNTDSKSLSSQFSSWNIYAKHIENFVIETEKTESVYNSDIIDLTAKNAEQILRVRKITNSPEDGAANYINDKKTQLESIFDPYRSPYFEILTNKIVCPEEFNPIYRESTNINNKVIYYILYANERFTYGVCSEDLIKYRAVVAFTYCKNTKDIYHLEYFIPNQEYTETAEETIRSFSC